MKADECSFLNRAVKPCGKPAVVTFRYASGVGACQTHLGPVLLWCMGKNARGDLPESTVQAVPTWRWEEQS